MNEISTLLQKGILGMLVLIMPGFYASGQPTPVNSWDFEPDAVTVDGQGNAALTNFGDVVNENVGTEPNPPGFGTYGVELNGSNQYFEANAWPASEPWQLGQPTGTFAVAIKTSPSGSTGVLGGRYNTQTPGNRNVAFYIGGGYEPFIWFGKDEGTVTGSLKYKQAALEANTRYILFFILDLADPNNQTWLIRVYNADTQQWLEDDGGNLGAAVHLDTPEPWRIGANLKSAGMGNFFLGTIYWARLYNVTLSITEMNQLVIATDVAMNKKPGLELGQNYPNPFYSSTMIRYNIPEYTKVRISVFDINGRLVKTLVNQNHHSGQYSVEWNTRDELGVPLPEGMYIYQLKTASFVQSKKMMLAR